jgi:hypothetical protein
MMSRPAPKHAPRVPFALLLAGLLVGGLAVLLGLNTASAANELRRHDLAARDSSVAARVEHLRNEIARSRAPGNLAQVAAALGMVPAGNPAFLQLGPDGRATVLGSPAPVTAPALGAAPATTAAHPPAPTKSETTTEKTPKKTTAHHEAPEKTRHHKKTSHPAQTSTAPRKPDATNGPEHPAPAPTTTLPGGAR